MTSHHELAMLRAELVGIGDTIADVPDDDPTLRHLAKQTGLNRVVAGLVTVIDEHPVNARGRCTTCRRRHPCPADVLLAAYAPGWLTGATLFTPRTLREIPADPGALS